MNSPPTRYAAALSLLPDEPLFALARRCVGFAVPTDEVVDTVAEVLRRPTGARVCWELVTAPIHAGGDVGAILSGAEAIVGRLSPAQRVPLCRDWLTALLDVEGQRLLRHDDCAIAGLASVVVRHWPPDLDASLLLDAYEQLSAQRCWAAATIRERLRMPWIDLTAAFGRLVDLAEVDPSDDDFELGLAIEATLPRLGSPEREAFVARGLRSDNVKLRGLAQCEVVASRPVGSVEVLFEQWWADPRLRDGLFAEPLLSVAFCPFLRRRLRAGKLSLHQASATMEAIGDLWGGIDDGSAEEERFATRQEFAAWHEGAPEIGPPTAEEWEALRALQDLAVRLRTHNAAQILLVRPAGRLHRHDLALIETLVARWRELPDASEDPTSPRAEAMLLLLLALARVRDPAVLPYVRELAAGPEPIAGRFAELAAELEAELDRGAN